MPRTVASDTLRSSYAVAALAALCAVVLLLSTRLGIGVTVDSTSYLGFRPHDAGYPPLYSGLMRLAAGLPVDVAVLARLYHVALYAAAAVVVWRLLHAATGRSAPAWAGAILSVFAGQAVVVYSMALSEPTFVVLTLLTLQALSSWVDGRTRRVFFIAAVLAALATLARYPGVALVATGALTVLVAGGGTAVRRVARSAAFATIGFAPLAIWMAYVALTQGTAVGREAGLAGTADASTLYEGLLEAARYLLPTDFPPALRIAALVTVLAAIGAATAAFYAQRERVTPHADRPHRYLPLILLGFVASYLSVLVLAVYVEPYLPILDRYLYPAYVALVMLGVIVLADLKQRRVLARRVVAVAVVGFVALSLVRTAKVVRDGYVEGWGYESSEWRSSATVAYVATLPPSTAVYSDDPYALLYLTKRDVEEVPQKIVRRLGAANPAFEHELTHMRERLEDTDGVVVIFERDRGKFVMPVLPDIERAMPIYEHARFEDAALYAVVPRDRVLVADRR